MWGRRGDGREGIGVVYGMWQAGYETRVFIEYEIRTLLSCGMGFKGGIVREMKSLYEF